MLRPFSVPTCITHNARNRPQDLSQPDGKPIKSQIIGQAMSETAVSSGKVSAADVARLVFDAVTANQFYIYSHPRAIGSVQSRLEDIMQSRNPSDPFAAKPEIGAGLRAALRVG